MASTVTVVQVVRALFVVSMLAGFITVFRPLLVGIGRALVLAVRPRAPKQRRGGSAVGG
jgi:hypothetical protein